MTPPLDAAIALLRQARDLGLTFERGSVYISRSYIDAQNDLRARIADLINSSGAEPDLLTAGSITWPPR